jgi:dolichol-phosphate mannosyltransferase
MKLHDAGTSGVISVVIPCYRAGDRVLDVIGQIGPEVGWIFVVDDKCPAGTGMLVRERCRDSRVQVIFHEENMGVGGAMVTGYRAALTTKARVVVKIDADGQMSPAWIPSIADAVLRGQSDYAKGNRFHRVRDVASMPWARLLGNAGLSFLTKLSSGYWQLFDPTNGFTAIHRRVLAELDLATIAPRYFFESDMLYHLNQLGAVVSEVPFRAIYGDEPSSLSPLRSIGPFFLGNMRNFARRILYSYYLRNFSLASLELLIGLPLVLFGSLYGLYHLLHGTPGPASAGVVMAAGLPVIVGTQLLLSWLNYDVSLEPRRPLHQLLPPEAAAGSEAFTEPSQNRV